MSEKVLGELFEEFSKPEFNDPAERARISYLILGRIAAGMEDKEPGVERVITSMGEVWMAAAERFDKVIKESPDRAFNLALSLTTLPVSDDHKIEEIQKWIRGDGPALLARKEIREQLLGYLGDKGKAEGLVAKLKEYLSYNFSKIYSKEDAFEDPNCYLSLASIYLGTKLEDAKRNDNAAELFVTAKEAIKKPDVIKVIDYFSGLEDTKWLADELKSFEVK